MNTAVRPVKVPNPRSPSRFKTVGQFMLFRGARPLLEKARTGTEIESTIQQNPLVLLRDEPFAGANHTHACKKSHRRHIYASRAFCSQIFACGKISSKVVPRNVAGPGNTPRGLIWPVAQPA